MMLRCAHHGTNSANDYAVAGDRAFKDANPSTPLLRADAFRHLTQNLGQAFDLALETKDPAYPVVHAFCTPLRKLGGDAADFTYQQAWVDGSHEYRIFGTKGTARFFNITVQGHRPDTEPGTGAPSIHEPFGDTPEANLFGDQIAAEPDGTFELFVGGPERAGNWLPTTSESRKLFIRQGFDRWDEEPWTLNIERVGMDAPRPMPTPETVMGAMKWAGRFLDELMEQWPDHRYQYSGGWIDPSLLNEFPQSESPDQRDALRGRSIAMMVWAIDPEEALIVEFDGGDAFWMASLGGVFMNSFDYLYRPVSYTPARTFVNGDGKARLVLTSEDPGCANWMDTQGFDQGILAFRTVMASSGPALSTRLVKRSDLFDALPPDTALDHVEGAQRTTSRTISRHPAATIRALE